MHTSLSLGAQCGSSVRQALLLLHSWLHAWLSPLRGQCALVPRCSWRCQESASGWWLHCPLVGLRGLFRLESAVRCGTCW